MSLSFSFMLLFCLDFKKRMMNADVVIAHPDVFQYCPSVLFSSELSLKFLQIIYAGCNQLLKALADNNAVSVSVSIIEIIMLEKFSLALCQQL